LKIKDKTEKNEFEGEKTAKIKRVGREKSNCRKIWVRNEGKSMKNYYFEDDCLTKTPSRHKQGLMTIVLHF
jgi:hypothetical protein